MPAHHDSNGPVRATGIGLDLLEMPPLTPGLDLVLGSPAALEHAFVARIRSIRASDALTPIAVVVGGVLQRPYLQRLLATLLGGVVNVRFLTLGELGLSLGENALLAQGARPLSALGERVFVAEVAREAEGYFEPVAATPGFADALRRLLRELRQEGIAPEALAAALRRAAESPEKAGALAALHATYARRRQGYYTGEDCLLTADPAALEASALLVYGIERLGAVARRLLEGVAARIPVTVFLPSLGETADAVHSELREWTASAGARVAHAEADAPGTALAHLQRTLFRPDGPAAPDPTVRLLSAPDPVVETREAARACLAWAAEGLDFRELAVTYRQAEVYRPLVEAVFAEAGIPVYVHDGASLAERPLGRRTLALLDLVGSPLRRRDVMRFVTDGRLPDETAELYGGAPPARWDELSRKAGVVEGVEQWRERLSRIRAHMERREAEDPADWRRERIASADHLLAFVEELDRRLRGFPERAPWSVHLAVLEGLLHDYVREGEQIAGFLGALRRLDALLPEVERDRFLAVVRSEVENLRTIDLEEGRQGAFARRGVNVLDVNQLRHLRFRGVCVLGLAERAFPPPPGQDPLLLDPERERLREAFPGFPLRARGPDPEPLQFALAVHAARERLHLSYPRADESGGRARLPSPFFRAAASALAGRRIRSAEVDGLDPRVFERVPAGRVGAGAVERSLSAREYERTLLESSPRLGRALLLETAPLFARAEQARRARFGARALTPYDGVFEDGGARAALRAVLERTLSPTNLETYAGCPHRFLLDAVLGLSLVEEPEAVERLSPLDRGEVVHRIFERFLGELGDAGLSPSDGDAHAARLRAIAAEELGRAEAEGITGYPLLWSYDRRMIEEDLDAWLREELGVAAAFSRRAYELHFGGEGEAQVELEAGGETLRFRGKIDRLEWTPGERFRVVDYKTGRAYDTRPALDGGRRLQLPVYLLAGARVSDTELARGRAEYFHVTRREDFRRVGMDGSYLAERMDDLREIAARIARGIGEGDFHREPEENACRFCDFDAVCPTARYRLAERKASDERVATLHALRELG